MQITNGLDEARLCAQMKEIDTLNETLLGFCVLKGSEVDILEDGRLDFDKAILRKLDIVRASIHSRFALDRDAQTRRLLRAIKNPYLTSMGHLTGRMLLKRPGYEFDTDCVLAAIKREGKLLENKRKP